MNGSSISKEVFIELLRNLSNAKSSEIQLDINLEDIDDNLIDELFKPEKFSPFPVSDETESTNDLLSLLQDQFKTLQLDSQKMNKNIVKLKHGPIDINNPNNEFNRLFNDNGNTANNNGNNNENLLLLGLKFLENLNKQQQIIDEYNDNEEMVINEGGDLELNKISSNVDLLQKEMEGLQEFVYDMTKNMGISKELFGNDRINNIEDEDANTDFKPVPKKKKKKKVKPTLQTDEDIILLTKDIWICEFCEYEKVFGEKPREMIKWYERHKNQRDNIEMDKQIVNLKKKKKKKRKKKK